MIQDVRKSLLRSAVFGFAMLLAAPAAAQETAPVAALPQNGALPCAKTPSRIYRDVSPAIVQVLSFGINPFRAVNRVETKVGSGVSLGDDLVATNFHVVLDAKAVAVGTEADIHEAEVIGRDPVLDVAVLRVPGLSREAGAIELATSDGVTVGDTAHVIGYPLGVGKSMSTGIISGVGRKIPLNTSSWLSPFVQTDAAVSAGNSGGALVDSCGRLIGLVTLRSQHPAAENIGYAIPVGTLRDLLPELIETGKVARPWHGLFGQMVTPVILELLGAPPMAALFTRGFLVETVEPGSAAERAGIRGGTLPVMWGMQEMILGGDIIIQVNGAPILTLDDAANTVRSLEIGQTVNVKLLRGGDVIEVSATLDERPILERDLELMRLQGRTGDSR